MQMSNNIKVFKFWMNAIEPFSDIEYQKRVWFRGEGKEVDSYEDAIDYILDFCERNLISTPKYFDPTTCSLIKEFLDKIDRYRHTDSYLNGASEEELFIDPKWLSIVQLAQKVYNRLDNNRMEAWNGEKRS